MDIFGETMMDIYSVVGFVLTVIGTVLGAISLIYAVYISKTAQKIKQRLMQEHIQDKYKKTKKTLLNDLRISYSMAKDEGIIDKWRINETIISLTLYNNILSEDTQKKIKKLKNALKKSSKKKKLFNSGKFNNTEEKIGLLVYELVQKLESDFDEQENVLEGITQWIYMKN